MTECLVPVCNDLVHGGVVRSPGSLFVYTWRTCSIYSRTEYEILRLIDSSGRLISLKNCLSVPSIGLYKEKSGEQAGGNKSVLSSVRILDIISFFISSLAFNWRFRGLVVMTGDSDITCVVFPRPGFESQRDLQCMFLSLNGSVKFIMYVITRKRVAQIVWMYVWLMRSLFVR